MSVLVALVVSATAWAAFQGLPPSGAVNDDTAAGIDPARGVDTADDPANADVTGGSLAGGVAVPWAILRAHTSAQDQIFERSFADGVWTTRGSGTLGGLSDSVRPFQGSLNFNQSKDGEAPSTDFAGTGRKVPWALWYESTTATGFNADNIFASRFDATSGKWDFEGQGRGAGGGTVEIPSLNIHTDRDAINPSVFGGATSAGADPVPWVAWQEVDAGASGPQQIFVSKAVKPSTAPTCPTDAGNPSKPAGDGSGAIHTFCWQQVGIDRLSATAVTSSPAGDPTLNVDPSRDGIEPDIAFTGTGDAVPWVVWYEVGTGSLSLHTNDMVFAARATTHAGADGQFQWTSVGTQGRSPGTGVLDTTGPTHAFGDCAENSTDEASCSLNADPAADAADPRVAAGTMTAGSPTVPWVVWEETSGGHERIFVSRLVGSGAAARFVVANGGQPLPTVVAGIDATRPDIAFSGNTPYVTWHEGASVVSGHFVTPDQFTIDNTAVGGSVPAGLRAPISSGCTANPTNNDGAACQGGALGTPFFLFTDGSPATISATVNPQGAPVRVHFDFGPTTAYGSSTAVQTLAAADAATPFSAGLSGLAAATVVHYRAVATTDFGTIAGPDQSVTTTGASGPPADKTPPKVTLSIGRTTIKKLLKSKKLGVTAGINEAGKVSLSATTKVRRKHKLTTVSLGKVSASFTSGLKRTLRIKLGSKARKALKPLKRATITVRAKATDRAGNTATKVAIRKIKRT
jgi:hypothetical protein